MKYLRETDQLFDAIILDLTDLGNGKTDSAIGSQTFYDLLSGHLGATVVYG